MNYFEPNEVLSPKDYVTFVEEIHHENEEDYSLAKITWEGDLKIAIRWNVAAREYNDPEKKTGGKKCVGMPSSHGYPVWFILPEEFLKEIMDKNSSVSKQIQSYL